MKIRPSLINSTSWKLMLIFSLFNFAHGQQYYDDESTTDQQVLDYGTSSEMTSHFHKVLQYGESCIPDLVEILAMTDVLTEAAAVKNHFINNFTLWDSEWEEKYIRYLTNPSPFSLQMVNKNQTSPVSGICSFTKLLHCYHTGAIKNFTNDNRDSVGACLPDRYYAHDPDNPEWSKGTRNVNVGYPCKFNFPRDSPLVELNNEGYDCATPEDKVTNASPPECRPVEISDNLDEKLASMMRVSGGIYFIGLGLRVPLRNYLVRYATHVCSCPQGEVANTKGSCVKSVNGSPSPKLSMILGRITTTLIFLSVFSSS